ncbi:MAG: GIY-YIG nuclease family protein [Patescibacteria group bacterium]
MEKLTKKLPDKPGVYIFRGQKRSILYIGKATFLRSRVQSYFRKDLMETRGPILVGMLETARTVDFIETDSVLEALILEAYLIKKHLPPFNTREKDNKSFNYVVITKEEFPRVITMRGRELETDALKIKYSFGPFPHGSALREALTIIRKIFPFRDKCKPNSGKPCFNAQIGLCPGICSGKITRKEYAKTIQRIKLFFEGKKQTLMRGIERDMKQLARELKFEEAGKLKRTLFSLNHIQDVALIKADFDLKNEARKRGYRIEAYDVAHISGTNTVGVMTVVLDGEVVKSDYRKFKIKTSTNDDNASLRETLSRRLDHPEWPLPKLIVVDGGKAQVNTARKVLNDSGIFLPIVGVVKDEHHRAREIIGDTHARKEHERDILIANSEAHRFAIGYHRTIRGKLSK